MQNYDHMPPGAIDASGGVLFLTLDRHDRTSIATSIERLINLLDDMEGDPDLEPYLAGYRGTGDDREGDLSDWEPACEDEGAQCEDEGAQCDDEGATDFDTEPALGWTEHVDQRLAGRIDQTIWFANQDDKEPDLGWTGFGRGCTDDEPRDDREGDDERDDDGDLHDDSGIDDDPEFIPGGGSVSQWEDGWREDPTYVPPVTHARRERARRLDDGVVVREVIPWPPAEAYEGMAPEVDLRRARPC